MLITNNLCVEWGRESSEVVGYRLALEAKNRLQNKKNQPDWGKVLGTES